MTKSTLASRAACLAAAAIPGSLVVAQTAPDSNWQLPAQELVAAISVAMPRTYADPDLLLQLEFHLLQSARAISRHLGYDR